jgi:flagellar basal body-associated protein FliL
MEVTLQILSIGVPIVTLIAAGVAVFLFVKNKGTMDAQREAANTWRELAESYQATIKKMEDDMEECRAEIAQLKEELLVQHKAMQVALDEIVAAFKRGKE